MPATRDLAQENEKIIRVMERANTTLVFVSQAYGFCKSYFSQDTEILKFVQSEPIKFARMTQQLFMIVQFCKLFEYSHRKGQHDSSLFNLNDAIRDNHGHSYTAHPQVNIELEQVKKSPSYVLFKTLRDKTYAHSDNDPLNLQLKFRFITESQVDDFKIELIKTIEVFNRMSHFYGFETTFHNFYDSSTPRNYLTGQIRNKEFFQKYYKDHKDFKVKR